VLVLERGAGRVVGGRALREVGGVWVLLERLPPAVVEVRELGEGKQLAAPRGPRAGPAGRSPADLWRCGLGHACLSPVPPRRDDLDDTAEPKAWPGDSQGCQDRPARLPSSSNSPLRPEPRRTPQSKSPEDSWRADSGATRAGLTARPLARFHMLVSGPRRLRRRTPSSRVARSVGEYTLLAVGWFGVCVAAFT